MYENKVQIKKKVGGGKHVIIVIEDFQKVKIIIDIKHTKCYLIYTTLLSIIKKMDKRSDLFQFICLNWWFFF